MSTLDIYTQLRDALQQVQEGFESQVAVEDLAARAAALDLSSLQVQLQVLDSTGQSWIHAVALIDDQLAAVLSTVHQPAVDAASAILEAIPGQLAASGAALSAQAEAVHSELGQFGAEDAHVREDSVARHSAYEQVARDFTASYEESYERLRDVVQHFASALEQQLQPNLARRVDDWLAGLDALRAVRLPAVEAELRSTFARATEEFMDLAENASNMYCDAARSGASDLERFAVDKIASMLEASVERLKRTAISMVEAEIANSIVETNLSVALTSALSPVMPQLIAFYKAATLLEEAIRIFKEMKRALTLGF